VFMVQFPVEKVAWSLSKKRESSSIEETGAS